MAQLRSVVRLRSVDVVSCAKMYGVLHMALGILFALLLVVVGFVGIVVSPRQQQFGIVGLLVFAALSPFLYGIFGFIAGAVFALIYNWIAPAVGGVKMELEAMSSGFFAPSSPAPRVEG